MRFTQILDRLKLFFRKLTGRSVEELDLTGKTPHEEKERPRKWWQFPFRVLQTARGQLDMPKSQPCPNCGARAKRWAKTASGARYRCRCKTTFFVRATKGQLREKRKKQRGQRARGGKRSASK